MRQNPDSNRSDSYVCGHPVRCMCDQYYKNVRELDEGKQRASGALKALDIPDWERKQLRPNRGGMGPNLHQNVGTNKTKVSVGKAQVIANRVISRDDNRTVIDKTTGKETQR